MKAKQTKKFKLFKPIVASSLALILGSSLYGQEYPNWIIIPEPPHYDKEIVSTKDTVTLTLRTGKTYSLTAGFFGKNLMIKTNPNIVKDTYFTGEFKQGMNGNINIGSATNISNIDTTLTFGDTSGSTPPTKELKGDITIYATDTAKNEINFKEDFKTQKIWTIQGKSTVTFEKNATMESSNEVIYTGWWQNRNANAEATFTFKGTNNIIKNTKNGIAIQANANHFYNPITTYNKPTKNILKFENTTSNNTIEGDIIAAANLNHDRKAINIITFSNQTGVNTIKGNIIAKISTESENNITFKGATSNIITGDIIANDGVNKISMSGTNTITGAIAATASLYKNKDKAKNIISLDNASTSMMTDGKTNTLKITDIISTGGKNFIGKNILSGSNGDLTDNTSKIFDTSNQASGTLEVTTIESTNGNNKINIETLTLQNNGKIDANGNAYNQINVKNLSTQSSANSTIIARWGGSNKIAASDSTNLTLSSLSAGDSSANDKNSTNIISLDNASTSMMAKDGTSSNTLTITSITSMGGKNFIGKNILSGSGTSGSNGDLTDNTSSMSFTNDTNAFEGVFQVGTMSSTNGGTNNISYKASVNILGTAMEGEKQKVIQNTIIGSLALNKDEATKAKNLLKTAISGNNNLYLDLSANTDFADVSSFIKNNSKEAPQTLNQETLPKIQAVILGNIDNQVNGTNNIKIVGGNSQSTTPTTKEGGMTNNHIKIGLIGNITTNGGSNNLIFENSIWLPSSIDKEKTPKVNLPTNLSGTLINKNNGNTNIVLRASDATLNNLGTSMFNINNQSGNVNIVVQGQINIGANVSYAGNNGNTTFIFANSNDMTTSAGEMSKAGAGKDSFSDNSTNTANMNNKVLGVTYQDGIKLTLKDRTIGKNQSFLSTYAHYFNNVAENNGILTLKTNRSLNENTQSDTITIKGLALGDISELAASNGVAKEDKGTTYSYNATLDKNSAFVGSISLQNNSNVKLTMNEGTKLLTDSKHLKIDTLTISATNGVKTDEILLNTFAQSNTIIDIATINSDGSLATNNNGSLNPATRTEFRLLEIGEQQNQKAEMNHNDGLQGNGALFRVYMNDGANQNTATLGGKSVKNNTQSTYGYAYSDRILVLSGNTTKSNNNVNYIQVLADASTNLTNVKYHGGGTETKDNIAVATVKGSNGSQVAKFEGATQIQGFDIVGTTLKAVATDQYGKVNGTTNNSMNNYTTYFVDHLDTRVSQANEQSTTAALELNYFMYMANINSLNKRMGELRYNANAQGVWARVFNGMLTSDLHTANTKSLYTTFQAGYDYAFGMEGANNYLGFALSYINAINDSQTKLDIDGLNKGVKDSISNGVEIALYNAYVQDGASKASGWKNGLYTDTILKFSFMNNKLHMFGQTNDYSINNFALTFSQEAGYRFLLGNHNEWFIDPQAELTIGFFDQSEFVQKLGNNYLVGTQNAILNIRGRVGSNFGYKFDHLTENKGFTSQLYLGMYYVGNYTSGGDGALVSNLGSKTTLDALTSHSSFLINVGTNFTIKDKHRIYFDFERSFFGPIITNYQVNLGYRFSFGESKYTPLATNLANEIKKAKK